MQWDGDRAFTSKSARKWDAATWGANHYGLNIININVIPMC